MAEKLTMLEVLQVFREQMDLKYPEKKDIPTTVSAFENDAKYQTEDQVNAKIKAQIASVYRPGGSCDFESLPELNAENMGLLVNVTNAFTTTDAFLDGAGISYPAGTNVAIVVSGEEYKYDAMSGVFDPSGLATTEELNEALKAYVKTSDLEVITREDVLRIFEEAQASQPEVSE